MFLYSVTHSAVHLRCLTNFTYLNTCYASLLRKLVESGVLNMWYIQNVQCWREKNWETYMFPMFGCILLICCLHWVKIPNRELGFDLCLNLFQLVQELNCAFLVYTEWVHSWLWGKMFVHADADNKTSMQFTIKIDSIKNAWDFHVLLSFTKLSHCSI